MIPLKFDEHVIMDDIDENDLHIILDDDLSQYLAFLQKMHIIKNREEAVFTALRIYKKLNMHDWLPYVYRTSDERILLIGQGMLRDLFTSISSKKLYNVAKMAALKRRLLNPTDENLDLSEPSNWGVILNELENMGWGKFTWKGEEVMVEFLGVPLEYLKGYLENLFLIDFGVHTAKDGDMFLLKRLRKKAEVWR